jgi:anti-anti-sigma factor
MEARISSYPISPDIMVLEISYEIDAYTAFAVRQFYLDILKSGNWRLIFDLSALEFLDSTGEGVLIGALKRVIARGHQKGLALIVTQERIMKNFRIHGTVKVFPIFDNITDAVAYMYADPAQVAAMPRRLADNEEVGWQWFPARIYTSSEAAGTDIEECLESLVGAFQMEIVYEFPIEHNSWFREYILRMKDSTALPTRDETLDLVRRGIEQRELDLPQAQIDVMQSQAVANLIGALDRTPTAVVQVGSMIIVKVRDTTVVRTLTQLEIAHWERNPGLFRNPEAALSELQRASDASDAAQGSQTVDMPS